MYIQQYRNKYGAKKVRNCDTCGVEYSRSKYSMGQWRISRFCSRKCQGMSQRKNDGFKNRYERYDRKNGALKQRTPEWLERIRATTKEAMLRPDVNAKIRKKRGKLSIEHRVKVSNALAGKLPKNMAFGGNSYPNIQRGDYENSKGTMYFRSKWEANYSLFLDYLVKQSEIKNWEYEADVFVFEKVQFGTRSYRPDFKVFNNDGSFEYHEVKGYMDGKSKTKLKRMAKYYPEIKLILVDSAYYNDLKKKMGKMLGFY